MIALKQTGTDLFMTGVDILVLVRIYKLSLMVSVFIFWLKYAYKKVSHPITA